MTLFTKSGWKRKAEWKAAAAVRSDAQVCQVERFVHACCCLGRAPDLMTHFTYYGKMWLSKLDFCPNRMFRGVSVSYSTASEFYML